MGESTESLPESGTPTRDVSMMDEFRRSLSAYTWFLWFLLFEAILVILAIVLDSVVGAGVTAGLLGAFAIVFAVIGVFSLVSLIIYRFAVRR